MNQIIQLVKSLFVAVILYAICLILKANVLIRYFPMRFTENFMIIIGIVCIIIIILGMIHSKLYKNINLIAIIISIVIGAIGFYLMKQSFINQLDLLNETSNIAMMISKNFQWCIQSVEIICFVIAIYCILKEFIKTR